VNGTVADGSLERSVAIAQEHQNATVKYPVSDGNVRFGIAVEITNYHALSVRSRAQRMGDSGLKRAIAFAQEHQDGVRT